jgi:hypothetical protein
MAVTIVGSGSITGLSAGGLPTGSVTADSLATNSVDSTELVSGAVDSSHLASGVGGKVLQVVQQTTRSTSTTSSLSFVATYSSMSITPSATTSKVLVLFDSGHIYQSNANQNFYHYQTIYRDSTNLASSNYGFTGTYVMASYGGVTHTYYDICWNASCSYLDSPSSIASVNYTIYHRIGQTGCQVHYGFDGEAVITLMEIGV